jgi:hypothetical protein
MAVTVPRKTTSPDFQLVSQVEDSPTHVQALTAGGINSTRRMATRKAGLTM